MRSVRMLLAITTVALAAGCAEATAGDRTGVWVEVSPSTVQAGELVAIRAACVNNSQTGSVTSDAFGTVSVTPKGGYLSAEVQVPPTARAGQHQVKVTCADGQTATTTLTVVEPTPSEPPGQPTVGPHTGGGYLGGEGAGSR